MILARPPVIRFGEQAGKTKGWPAFLLRIGPGRRATCCAENSPEPPGTALPATPGCGTSGRAPLSLPVILPRSLPVIPTGAPDLIRGVVEESRRRTPGFAVPRSSRDPSAPFGFAQGRLLRFGRDDGEGDGPAGMTGWGRFGRDDGPGMCHEVSGNVMIRHGASGSHRTQRSAAPDPDPGPRVAWYDLRGWPWTPDRRCAPSGVTREGLARVMKCHAASPYPKESSAKGRKHPRSYTSPSSEGEARWGCGNARHALQAQAHPHRPRCARPLPPLKRGKGKVAAASPFRRGIPKEMRCLAGWIGRGRRPRGALGASRALARTDIGDRNRKIKKKSKK